MSEENTKYETQIFESKFLCDVESNFLFDTDILSEKKTRDSSRVFLYVENIVSDFRIFTRSLHTIICTAVKTCQENQKKTSNV